MKHCIRTAVLCLGTSGLMVFGGGALAGDNYPENETPGEMAGFVLEPVGSTAPDAGEPIVLRGWGVGDTLIDNGLADADGLPSRGGPLDD